MTPLTRSVRVTDLVSFHWMGNSQLWTGDHDWEAVFSVELETLEPPLWLISAVTRWVVRTKASSGHWRWEKTDLNFVIHVPLPDYHRQENMHEGRIVGPVVNWWKYLQCQAAQLRGFITCYKDQQERMVNLLGEGGGYVGIVIGFYEVGRTRYVDVQVSDEILFLDLEDWFGPHLVGHDIPVGVRGGMPKAI